MEVKCCFSPKHTESLSLSLFPLHCPLTPTSQSRWLPTQILWKRVFSSPQSPSACSRCISVGFDLIMWSALRWFCYNFALYKYIEFNRSGHKEYFQPSSVGNKRRKPCWAYEPYSGAEGVEEWWPPLVSEPRDRRKDKKKEETLCD